MTTTLIRPGQLPDVLLSKGIRDDAPAAVADWRGDPQWVRDLRRQGWGAWEDIPMPTKTSEGWRRADLRWLQLDQVRPATALPDRVENQEDLPAELTAQMTEAAASGVLVQRDGGTAYGEIANNVRDQGVIFTDIHTALRDHSDLVRRYFMQVVPARWQPGMPSNNGKFEALNAALFNGGSFLYVPPDTTVALPLRAVYWASEPSAAFFPRTLIVADRGSRVVFLEEYRSVAAAAGGAALFGSAASEAYVADGARLDYVTIQDWSQSTGGFITQRVHLGNDAYVNWVVVALGGIYSRMTADVLLNGKGTRADLLGLAFGEKTQVFDIHTLQDHLSPYTDSDQFFKTALRDRARLAYEGLIDIRKGSYGSNGYQANKNLLLDDTAKADSIPMLQINDNDVRCTHSSASGPVEEHHVHYLMTRGLPRPDAERLVVQGHFEPVIARIAVEELKDTIREAVDRRIGY